MVLLAVVSLIALVVNTQLLVWQLRRRDDAETESDDELSPAIGVTLEPFPEAWWDDDDTSDTSPVGFTRPKG